MTSRLLRSLFIVSWLCACAGSNSNSAGVEPVEPRYDPARDAFISGDPSDPDACRAHWAKGDLPVYLVTNNSLMFRYLDEASEEWNMLIGSKTLVPLMLQELPGELGAGNIIVVKVKEIEDPNELANTYYRLGNDCAFLSVTITVDPRLTMRVLPNTISHEVGHALGLRHTLRPQDTMYPSVFEGPFFVEEGTVTVLRQLYGP